MLNKHMLWLFREEEEFFRVRLSKRQRKVLGWAVEKGSITTADVVEKTGEGRQHASEVLTQLLKKGYLVRKPDPTSRNGLSYIYICDPKKWGK